MTRTLILTRHAKSAWDDPMLDDFDRTLNARGQHSAVAIGHWLVKHAYLPQTVVVSAARRTVQTWSQMAHLFPEEPTIESTPALYHANADMIMKTIHGQTAQTLMVICHNPGIADFANRLADEPADHPRFSDYPTGATSVFKCPVDAWSQLQWHSATIDAFAIPRELPMP